MTSKESKRDRFLDLPVEIIHRIHSFMVVTQIVKTSLLSKRWRFLWMDAKYLNFDACRDNRNNLKRKRSDCPDFVDHVLALRNSPLDIYKFSYSCHEKFSMDRLDRWITIGLRQNICELHLQTYFPPIQVPDTIFQSPTMKVFKLHQLGRYAVRLPPSMCSATMITTLELHSARLPPKDPQGGLLIDCPVLENLVIRNCDEYRFKTLNISTFQLKSFELFTVNVKDLQSLCKVYVNTPNLTSIKFLGSMHWECRTKNLPALVTAEVDLKKAKNMEEILYARNLYDVLRMIKEVQILTLSTSHVKVLTTLLRSSPILLYENLGLLELVQSPIKVSNSAITTLAKRLPRVHTIIFKKLKNASDSAEETEEE